VANGLVERRGLSNTAGAVDELESMGIVVMQASPEQLGQRTFDRASQGWRDLTRPLPGVLFLEDPLQVFRLRSPDNQRLFLLVSVTRSIALTP
jgi:hypothetical protein